MRRLKKMLGDGTVYTFTTLSRLDMTAFQKLLNSSGQGKLDKLQKKMETDGLSDEEFEEFNKMQEERLSVVNKLIRTSLAPQHKEFALSNDPSIESKLNEKLEAIIDLRDTTQLVEFATTGTITQSKEVIAKDEDLVL